MRREMDIYLVAAPGIGKSMLLEKLLPLLPADVHVRIFTVQREPRAAEFAIADRELEYDSGVPR